MAGRIKRSRMKVVNAGAAGIDVGARFHVVAVSGEVTTEPVRQFDTFTGDLHRLADWLAEVGVTSVAMESTGVYWIPVFEILEQRGLEVILVNARDVKNVPGRKTDFNDAQWIQQLHEYGLLRASFRPIGEIVELRGYLRHRSRLVESAATEVQRMQKALMQMNLQLHHVVTDMTGKTGMAILRSIVAGERDPEKLALHRDMRCKADRATIEAALDGNYRREHVFALRQSLELYDILNEKIAVCDGEIEQCLASLTAGRPEPDEPLPKPRHRTRSKNAPDFDVRSALHLLVGVDLTQIQGLGPHAALKLVAECGTDMSKWATSKHFTSWLTLAPGAKISGGKILSAKTRRSASRATTVLRLAAVSVSRTQTALGAFFRRLAARVGKAKAVTATARKIAVLFYNTLKHGATYVDPGADYYEQRYRDRVVRGLRARAASFGYSLVEADAADGVS